MVRKGWGMTVKGGSEDKKESSRHELSFLRAKCVNLQV